MHQTFHIVAGSLPRLFPLVNRQGCADLWRRLRAEFPEATACILMPDHLHIVTVRRRPQHIRWDLGVVLRAWTQRHYPDSKIWGTIPEPELVPDTLHLKRLIRYVHLNPCRSKLTSDPLEWEWSTHRDYLNCVADPWPNRQDLAKLFHSSLSQFPETVHRYISSDPSVQIGGTPALRSINKEPVRIAADLDLIVSASSAALRTPPLAPSSREVRNLAIQVATRIGMGAAPGHFEVGNLTWRRAAAASVRPSALDAVRLLLSDERLIRGLRNQASPTSGRAPLRRFDP